MSQKEFADLLARYVELAIAAYNDDTAISQAKAEEACGDVLAAFERLTAENAKLIGDVGYHVAAYNRKFADMAVVCQTLDTVRGELAEAKRQRDMAERELFEANKALKLAAEEGVHVDRRFHAIATIAYELNPEEVGAIDKVGEIHRLAKAYTCVLGQPAECGDYHNAGQCVRPRLSSSGTAADPGGLREQLAAIEHERWADWQRYMHGLCDRWDDGSLQIPANLAARWEQQIATPYAELSEREKDSDREQVDRYWHLISAADTETSAPTPNLAAASSSQAEAGQ